MEINFKIHQKPVTTNNITRFSARGSYKTQQAKDFEALAYQELKQYNIGTFSSNSKINLILINIKFMQNM
jgi:hypothetical protein